MISKNIKKLLKKVEMDRILMTNGEDQQNVLKKYTIDVTQKALDGKLDPVIEAKRKLEEQYKFYQDELKIIQF